MYFNVLCAMRLLCTRALVQSRDRLLYYGRFARVHVLVFVQCAKAKAQATAMTEGNAISQPTNQPNATHEYTSILAHRQIMKWSSCAFVCISLFFVVVVVARISISKHLTLKSESKGIMTMAPQKTNPFQWTNKSNMSIITRAHTNTRPQNHPATLHRVNINILYCSSLQCANVSNASTIFGCVCAQTTQHSSRVNMDSHLYIFTLAPYVC